jgi:hypothetical protein
MNKNILIGIVILVVIGIGYWAYASTTNNGSDPDTVSQSPIVTSGENPADGDQVHGLPVEPAAAVARKDLAARLSIDEKSIVIMQVANTTWNDSCLGLGKANESCLQALVPGFKVELLSKGETYTYRTDATGATVRAETR